MIKKEIKNKVDKNPYDSIALKTNKNTNSASLAKHPKIEGFNAKKNLEMQQNLLKEKEDNERRKLMIPNLVILNQDEPNTFEKEILGKDLKLC